MSLKSEKGELIKVKAKLLRYRKNRWYAANMGYAPYGHYNRRWKKWLTVTNKLVAKRDALYRKLGIS